MVVAEVVGGVTPVITLEAEGRGPVPRPLPCWRGNLVASQASCSSEKGGGSSPPVPLGAVPPVEVATVAGFGGGCSDPVDILITGKQPVGSSQLNSRSNY